MALQAGRGEGPGRGWSGVGWGQCTRGWATGRQGSPGMPASKGGARAAQPLAPPGSQPARCLPHPAHALVVRCRTLCMVEFLESLQAAPTQPGVASSCAELPARVRQPAPSGPQPSSRQRRCTAGVRRHRRRRTAGNGAPGTPHGHPPQTRSLSLLKVVAKVCQLDGLLRQRAVGQRARPAVRWRELRAAGARAGERVAGGWGGSWISPWLRAPGASRQSRPGPLPLPLLNHGEHAGTPAGATNATLLPCPQTPAWRPAPHTRTKKWSLPSVRFQYGYVCCTYSSTLARCARQSGVAPAVPCSTCSGQVRAAAWRRAQRHAHTPMRPWRAARRRRAPSARCMRPCCRLREGAREGAGREQAHR